jgi:predicted dehydrogenase
MRERIRVAVVGLGYWGPNLIRNLLESPLYEVACVCDTRPEAIDAVQRRHRELRGTTRFDDILDDPTIDAVLIATPISTHQGLALAALKAGKHTFVEKPLASSSDQALELARVAASNRLVLMPGHTFLYSPPVRRIKRLIDDGELGDIYFISSSRVNLGLHQADASVVWDLGAHDFSILRYWLDRLPTEVSALSRSCILPGVPDVCFINLSYSTSAVASVELSWLAPSKLRRTAVVGSQKMVLYDDTSTESVRVFDSGADISDPETFGEYRMTYRTGDIVSLHVEASEPLALELADFAAAIRNGTPPMSSPEIGLDVIRTIEAVDRSIAADGAPTPVSGTNFESGLVETLLARAASVG